MENSYIQFNEGGVNLPGEDESWDFGTGAGFYVDATREPWSRHYRMASYVTEELLTDVLPRVPLRDDKKLVCVRY